jgi:hypothetical protein
MPTSPGQIPPPPTQLVVGHGAQTAVTIVMGTLAALTLLFALWHWRRSRTPTFLLLFVVGGLMVFFEPMVDTVGAVWFPKNSWTAFHAYGRFLPVWVWLTYFCFFGLGVGLVWLALKARPTASRIWGLFAAVAIGDCIMEVILLHLQHVYAYYGHQPLTLLRFPLWWAPVNALIIVAAAAAIRRLDAELQGIRRLAIIPIGLTCSAALNAAAGWPSWLVINSRVGTIVIAIGGIATFAIASWIVAIVARYATGPEPAHATVPAAARLQSKSAPVVTA